MTAPCGCKASLVVTGGRDFGAKPRIRKDESRIAFEARIAIAQRQRLFVFETLDNIRFEHGVARIAEGGATGADRVARDWAKSRGVPCRTYEARWNTYGRSAGPMRNVEMLRKENPDFVLAFPGHTGTADCCRQAAAMGIEVRRVQL